MNNGLEDFLQEMDFVWKGVRHTTQKLRKR
jgi:hypothetical protein